MDVAYNTNVKSTGHRNSIQRLQSLDTINHTSTNEPLAKHTGSYEIHVGSLPAEKTARFTHAAQQISDAGWPPLSLLQPTALLVPNPFSLAPQTPSAIIRHTTVSLRHLE